MRKSYCFHVCGAALISTIPPILQYELSETASTLQAERSLAKSQNLWLEKMGEKDVANSLDTSNLCELVSYIIIETISAFCSQMFQFQ